MRITQATIDQAGQIGMMIGALLAELSGEPDRVDREPCAREVLGLPSVTGLLAWQGDQPLGLLMLNECAAIYAGGRFGEITELYVVPEARSTGVAAALVAAAVRVAGDKGWRRLEVGAPAQPAWARTLAFYERQGFAPVGPRLRRIC
jgi:GNAT superfamily N-acetyltransferase